jgi:hypothetical protein
MTHAHNPGYLGGRDQEDQSLRRAEAKCLKDPNSTNKKWALVMPTCHPGYVGSINKRKMVQASQT